MTNKLLTVICVFILSLRSFSQTIERVANINPNGDSYPGQLLTFNNYIYFVAQDSTNKNQLWMTDGTVQGTQLVKEICTQCANAYIDHLIATDSRLFFHFHQAGHDTLWTSDGTTAGTQTVKAINPTGNSYASGFTAFNDKVFFSATDGVNGIELWCSDGTVAGTYMVKDINTSGDGNPSGFTVYQNNLYFSADSILDNSELWISDGTAQGTKLFKEINQTEGSYPTGFFVFGNKLYFRADDGVPEYNNEPWVSDGTVAGTHILHDVNPYEGSYIVAFAPFDSLFCFLGSDGTSYGLCTSDGTDSGTHYITKINYLLSGFNAYNHKLYFHNRDSLFDGELWVSDGTAAGTMLMKNINPSGSSDPIGFITYNGHLIFTATDGISREIWVTDGATATTYNCTYPLATKTNPVGGGFLEYHGSLYFAANYDTAGLELYRFYMFPANIKSVELTNHPFDIYPNPARNTIEIASNSTSKISINNLLGQKMTEMTFYGRCNIDISGYKPGIYLARDEKGNYSKFIKE